MKTLKLKNRVERWGEYNVVMELKHAKPKMNEL
jgi:hypothetical protein